MKSRADNLGVGCDWTELNWNRVKNSNFKQKINVREVGRGEFLKPGWDPELPRMPAFVSPLLSGDQETQLQLVVKLQMILLHN